MQSIERRIAALETSAIDGRLKIIIVLDGETQADALRRLGYPPDALGVVYGSQFDAVL